MLIDLHVTLLARGIEFRLAETHGTVARSAAASGPAHAVALAEANQTVDDVLSRWRTATTPPLESCPLALVLASDVCLRNAGDPRDFGGPEPPICARKGHSHFALGHFALDPAKTGGWHRSCSY